MSAIILSLFESYKRFIQYSFHFSGKASRQEYWTILATHLFISLDVLNTILKEEILEWTVTETASVQDKHFTYTLSDSEQKMICLISTAQGNGDGRFLQIAFLSSPTNISTYLPPIDTGAASCTDIPDLTLGNSFH